MDHTKSSSLTVKSERCVGLIAGMCLIDNSRFLPQTITFYIYQTGRYYSQTHKPQCLITERFTRLLPCKSTTVRFPAKILVESGTILTIIIRALGTTLNLVSPSLTLDNTVYSFAVCLITQTLFCLPYY